ncbi:helix-turn-helix domain-containing protein [Leptospira alexanderi]|nr:helix-turn-helix transcriptional regulator [Leptospira alexanderi]
MLSELVTELMELENISVRELAKITKLSPTSIQELKSGKKDNPTFLSLLKIVEALGGAIVFKKGNKELVHVP